MRRFISGALCPSCQEQDTLFFEGQNQEEVFCTRCDYSASRNNNIRTEMAFSDSKEGERKELGKPGEQKIKWH